jgi:UDP-N-acetylmuramoyl-L-alanyl-D-glutamate--2,6-diaminopimelate ligase
MMKLCNLLSPWLDSVSADIHVEGIANDHRLVKPGYVFFAYEGNHLSGLNYVLGAIENGAVVIVHDEQLKLPQLDVPVYAIKNLPSLMSSIASHFYKEPFRNLSSVGITGTNGKTTVAYLLMQAHILLGENAAYIGTLGVGNMQIMEMTGLTTPGPIEVNAYARQLVGDGVSHLAIEVSSHGLDQGRVTCIPFEQAIFTNLSHDHLDYHGTIENYAAAKAKLFKFPSLKSIIINDDDSMSDVMLKGATSKAKIYRFGFKDAATIQVINMNWSLQGMHLACRTPWGLINLQSSLLGDFNVYNILAVFTSLMASGYDLAQVSRVIAQLQAAPGRMQVVHTKPLVIVDYAHTPDALEKALKTLKAFKQSTNAGKLWVVFGCGGDRDPFKRPIMGKIAASESDMMVVTSDNPRHENPERIIQEIMTGIPIQFKNKLAIEDRRLAIISALQEAHDKDIILIAGKGHEDYQQIGDVKHFFSDQFVVKDYYTNLKNEGIN